MGGGGVSEVLVKWMFTIIRLNYALSCIIYQILNKFLKRERLLN